MRKIVTTTFITLDGVMQAPGGPEEDVSGGFKYGGWSFPYWDKEVMPKTMGEYMNYPFELLLGGKTYDIFAAHWPTSKEQPVADKFNATVKYVVSRGAKQLSWKNSKLITGDAVAEIEKLKAMGGPDLWVHGSGNLIQTLLANKLIDLMIIWTFPVTVGGGKRLFAEGTQPQEFKMVDLKQSSTGVTIASYEPAGPIKTGSFGQ